MKKFAALVLALGALIGLPAPASAASTVVVEFNDGVLWDDCFEVPIKLSVTGDSPAVRFEASVTLRDPAGYREEAAAEFGFELEADTVSGSVAPGGAVSTRTAQPILCGFEGAGTWRANVTVKYFDINDAEVASVSASDTAEFRLRNSTTTLSRRNGELVVQVNAEVPGGGFAPCRQCFTRVFRVKGTKLTRVAKGDTNKRGILRTGFKPTKGLYQAVTPPGFFSSYAQSESATLRVR